MNFKCEEAKHKFNYFLAVTFIAPIGYFVTSFQRGVSFTSCFFLHIPNGHLKTLSGTNNYF